MDKKKRLAWKTFKDVFSLSRNEISQYSVLILASTTVYGSFQLGWKYLPLGILAAIIIVGIARAIGLIDENPDIHMM